ncbi:MAG TPA: YciI family protein [Roseiarcus sp.]|nr:YciI family protein [Roseiarcus sp.]
MKPFVYRLLPPRPSFAQDMTEEDRAVMLEHSAYLRRLAAKGEAVAFGPVLDPKGSWGVGLFQVESAERMEEIARADPAIRSGRGFAYEILPMAALVTGAGAHPN